MAAITSLALGLASTAYSVSQNISAAADAADAQKKAEQSAENSIRKAEQQQEQNFMGKLQIPMEAYDRALREGTAQEMQSIQALQEGDPRNLAAGIGKVNAVSLQQQNIAREAQASDLFALNKAQAVEQGDTADKMAALYENKATGAQIAAAAAEKANVNAITGAAQGVSSLIGQIDNMQPLYGKGAQGRLSSRIGMKMANGDTSKAGKYAQALYGKYTTDQLRQFEKTNSFPTAKDLGIIDTTITSSITASPFATDTNTAAVTTPVIPEIPTASTYE